MSAERKLDIIRNDVVLSPSDFNLVPNDTEAAHDALGAWLAFASTIEEEVTYTADMVRIITPQMNPEIREFVDLWEPQETGHGAVLKELAENVGIDQIPNVDKRTRKMKTLGMLASKSKRFNDIVTFIYLTYGAIAEDETMNSYRLKADQLEALGEADISVALRAIAAQEARHRAYYIDAAIENRPGRLGLSAARLFIEHLYTPVGVHRSDKSRLRSFGRAIFSVFPDGDFSSVTEQAEAVARRIIPDISKGFLSDVYQKAVDETLSAEAA